MLTEQIADRIVDRCKDVILEEVEAGIRGFMTAALGAGGVPPEEPPPRAKPARRTKPKRKAAKPKGKAKPKPAEGESKIDRMIALLGSVPMNVKELMKELDTTKAGLYTAISTARVQLKKQKKTISKIRAKDGSTIYQLGKL